MLVSRTPKSSIGRVIVTTAALVAIAATALLPSGKAQALDAYDTLRAKVVDYMTGGSSSSSTDPDIVARVAKIDSDANGFWSSMDTSTGRTALWTDAATVVNRASLSYGRLSAMALSYSTPGSTLYGNAALLGDTVSGLDWITSHWYDDTVNRDSSSWYFTEISAPINLLNAAALLYDHLSSTQLASYLAASDHFTPTPEGFTGDYVAANRVWKAYAVMMSGILSKNSQKLALVKDSISQVLVYVPGSDGFYVDGSFVQHSWYPYAGSYGTSLISNLATLLYVLKGSTWEVTDANLSNVYSWVYDTFEPILFDGVLMDAFRGREISRYQNQDIDAGGTLIAALSTVARTAPSSQSARLSSMIKYLAQSDVSTTLYTAMPVSTIAYLKSVVADSSVVTRGPLSKEVRYPAEDRVVHLQPTWAFALGLHSNRSKNFENITGENKHGWFTADGMTYLYTDGDPTAYSDNYWATVNPYRLPGTTTEQKTVADGTGVSTPWTSTMTWTGGSSIDGEYGTTAMYLKAEQSNLSAKKSWFMFDDKIVSLGSGVTSSDTSEVDTTIENRKLDAAGDNALEVDGVSQSTALAAATQYGSVHSLYLAGTGGYYFPTPTTLNAHRYARTGSWSDINDAYTDGIVHSNNFMELWMDHGTAPSNGSYAYVTLPNATAAQTTAYASSPDISVLENSTAASAVSDSTLGVAGYNFWNDGTYTVGPVTVDRKASVMTKSTTDELEVSVSDPTQQNAGSINVEIAATAASVASLPPNVTVTQLTPTIKFTVNTANTKGRDVTVTFRTTATGSTTIQAPLAQAPTAAANPIAPSTEETTTVGAVPTGWTTTTNGMGTVGVQIFTNSGNWFNHSTQLSKTSTGYGLYLRRSFAASSPNVGVAAYVTAAQTTSNWRMIVKSGSTEAVKITFNGSGNIVANNTIAIMPYKANTPYLVEIKANTTTDTFDLYIDSVKRGSNLPLETPVASLDSEEFSAYSADTGTIYVDEARVYNYAYTN